MGNDDTLPQAGKIPLVNCSDHALCDLEDFDYLMQWQWFKDQDGYVVRLDSTDDPIFMHDMVMERAIHED